MDAARELLTSMTVPGKDAGYSLSLWREDLSHVYPGMYRYVLEADGKSTGAARFITNTYEYSPQMPGSAESAARQTMAIWEQDLKADPAGFFANQPAGPRARQREPPADLLVLQGSPRPDGNCAILAEWAVEAARECGKTTRVIYPHDLDIHPCIGCYQCFNSGTCVFDDDMDGIIDAIRDASLVIVCSPVYTNTVPAGLKLVIDRMQAYYAQRILSGGREDQLGLVWSVAGRPGPENFTCITRVITAFFHTLGIRKAGEVLIDSSDRVHDIRTVPGKEEEVKRQVRNLVKKKYTRGEQKI